MPRSSDKRDRLIAAATQLIYQQGYHRTTLADVASVSGVPLGNVYYYFKTKEELGAAVIELRTEQFLADTERWEMEHGPADRLGSFLDCHLSNQEALAHYGCPIGSLAQELDKQPSRLTEKADANLKSQLTWVTKQLRALGIPRPEGAAEELLARLQGAILLACATRDESLILRQVQSLEDWLEQLPRRQTAH
jgi:AcrR family transcriptional regulator